MLRAIALACLPLWAIDEEVLKLQVLLDRAQFSPGQIDGVRGKNFERAVRAYGDVAALGSDAAPVLMEYTISEEDVRGPFQPIPEDMLEKAKLERLGYESPLEALAERFHASPKLLEQLNPEAAFDRARTRIRVPNVVTAPPQVAAASIEVSKAEVAVRVLDAQGKLVAWYPATVGSEHDPLPIGEWKINGVQFNPPFHYNPKLFWDADPSHPKARVAPGPNNPAGVVWIDLSKEHYGIHGTPEPGKVGYTQSHGCIRLTNWDAAELAAMVKPGMPVRLTE